jgi:amino acid transporter
LIDHRTNGSDLAEQTGRKAWFTAEEMNQWRAERKMAPWYKRIYRMLFSQ